MRTTYGCICTEDTKIWFWICWWDGEVFEEPMAA